VFGALELALTRGEADDVVARFAKDLEDDGMAI
jgi:hypothetical protein